MKKIAVVIVILVVLLLVGVAFAQGSVTLPWSVIGSGGGEAQAGSISLDGTIGQPIIGHATGSPYALCAGYWCGTSVQYQLFLPLTLK